MPQFSGMVHPKCQQNYIEIVPVLVGINVDKEFSKQSQYSVLPMSLHTARALFVYYSAV